MSGHWAGTIHRSSLALAAEGPWELVDIKCLAADTIVRTTLADGLVLETKHGGTCECCGMSINNIAYFRRADGKRITLGLDCARTLISNQGDAKALARLKRAESAHEKQLRDARKSRAAERKAAKLAETAKANVIAHVDLLARLDAAASYHPAFGDMAARIRSGRVSALSEKQAAWLESVERGM